MEIEKAEGYPSVGHLTFLITSYTNSAFYFEVVECGRRLFLASIIGIVSPDANAAPVMGTIIAIIFSLVFSYVQPLKKEDTILG